MSRAPQSEHGQGALAGDAEAFEGGVHRRKTDHAATIRQRPSDDDPKEPPFHTNPGGTVRHATPFTLIVGVTRQALRRRGALRGVRARDHQRGIGDAVVGMGKEDRGG